MLVYHAHNGEVRWRQSLLHPARNLYDLAFATTTVIFLT